MKPAPFQYFAPTTISETLDLLAQYGADAKLLAGGQSLVPTMNFRLATPTMLIDLNRVNELAYIQSRGHALAIGAMTRQRAVERDAAVGKIAPLVAETMPFIAHPQIRNRGTFGGSLAHADPASELPAVAIALSAKLKAKNKKGERWIDARDFFVSLFTTALEPDEMLIEIELPALPPRTGWSFMEVARRHGDYALAGVTAIVSLNANGACENARIVLMSVGATPMDAQNAAKILVGEKPDTKAIQAAANAVDAEIDPSGDIHASAEFRRHLARVLTRRALTMALQRAK